MQVDLLDGVTAYLPENIKHQVRTAIDLGHDVDPSEWCDYLAGVMQLVDEPLQVIEFVRQMPHELVCS